MKVVACRCPDCGDMHAEENAGRSNVLPRRPECDDDRADGQLVTMLMESLDAYLPDMKNIVHTDDVQIRRTRIGQLAAKIVADFRRR